MICACFARYLFHAHVLTVAVVKDASILLRDIAGDAASNAANRVRPDQDDLARIDAPAQDNVWHDTPDLSKDTMKQQFQSVYKGNPKEDVKDAANAGVSTAHPTGSTDARGLAETAAHDQRTGGASGINATAGASNAVNTGLQRLDDNIDDETKDKARQKKEEYRVRTKEYLKKKMPEERRDQVIWRLKVRLLPVTTIIYLFGDFSDDSLENGARMPATSRLPAGHSDPT